MISGLAVLIQYRRATETDGHMHRHTTTAYATLALGRAVKAYLSSLHDNKKWANLHVSSTSETLNAFSFTGSGLHLLARDQVLCPNPAEEVYTYG